jgi:hypothetical protein
MDLKTNKTPKYFFSIEEKHSLIKDYLSSSLNKEAFWQMRIGKPDHGRLLEWM